MNSLSFQAIFFLVLNPDCQDRMYSSIRQRYWPVLLVILLLIGCGPKPKPVSPSSATISINADTLYDGWTANDLFKNDLFAQDQFRQDPIELRNDTAQIEIRAFQHRFFNDTTRLKPTWVVGYVSANTPNGHESLPGPVLRATYGLPANVRYINRLDETMRKNPQYPYLKLELKSRTKIDSCRWYPIVYDVKHPRAIDMVTQMLYPIDSIKPDGKFPICRGLGNAYSMPEMSTYYSTTVHLHGANVSWHNDGYVNSSVLQTKSPFGRVPISFGLFGPQENHSFAAYTYPNTFPEGQFDSTGRANKTLGQHGAILWYHDHSMMRTTTNVYAGLAGAYIIEGRNEYDAVRIYPNKPLNWFQEWANWLRRRKETDIPLVISDKSFTKDGTLYYNSTGSKSDSGKDTIGGGNQPEFLGNTITVNGKIWPFMKVEAETYRFRLLNASSTRFYRFGLRMKHSNRVDTLATKLDSAVFVQIGTEGGLMTHFVRVTANEPLTLAPGERADVLIDFSRFKKADSLALVNYAPNAVYQGDSLVDLNGPIDKDHLTNMVMAFVLNSDGSDKSGKLQGELDDLQKSADYENIISNLASFDRVQNQAYRVNIAKSVTDSAFCLNLVEATTRTDFPTAFQAFLGKRPVSFPMVLMSEQDWDSEADTPSRIKQVQDGTKEVWAICNETGDRHPIHIHLNRFKIIGRRETGTQDSLTVQANELGWKDVVQCPPGQTTYVEVQYLLNTDATQQTGREPAQFVYHCHILEHEDASMMRRLVVLPK